MVGRDAREALEQAGEIGAIDVTGAGRGRDASDHRTFSIKAVDDIPAATESGVRLALRRSMGNPPVGTCEHEIFQDKGGSA